MKPPRVLVCLVYCLAAVNAGSLGAASGEARAPAPPRTRAAANTYRGGLVNPPLPKPRFTLTDTAGAPFDFWARTQGYVTLLFFGTRSAPTSAPCTWRTSR